MSRFIGLASPKDAAIIERAGEKLSRRLEAMAEKMQVTADAARERRSKYLREHGLIEFL